MGARFQRSWQVAKESYSVLKSNPSLAFFPVVSGLATIFVSIPFMVIIGLAAMHETPHHQAFGVIHYVAMGLMYFLNYFLVIFFNSALVACANENLQGRATTMGFGMRAAIDRLPQIVGWALIASTVGLILRIISERVGFVGQIIAGLIGFAWNLAVFFVVPVMVIDRESPFAAVKTSSGMLKRTWGERLILGFGVGAAIGVLGLIALIPLFIGIALLVAALYPLAILAFICFAMCMLLLAVVGSAMTAIYQTALYLYCRHGAIPHGFSTESMQGAFAVKPQSKIRSMFGGR